MEYHQDRFDDYSLMIYSDEKLVALLPGNRDGKMIYSHQGLSYGGLLINDKLRFESYIEVFKALLIYLQAESIEVLHLKKLPFIYHKTLSDEISYVLSALDANQTGFDSYFVLEDVSSYQPNRNRKRAIKISEKEGVVIANDEIAFFWKHVLEQNLAAKFDVKPVHTIEEIKYLMTKFPEHIKFYSAKSGNEVLAGAVLFVTDNVVHFQYSSGTEKRTENGSLDALFHFIIQKYHHKKYISFGSSSTDKSLKIDKGLAYWKESFGARVMPQESYSIQTKNHFKLDTIFK
ncbi:GNAT family N-acetyltransferase [Lacinutrix iliipiscaria]|uniref:GNAT family N-acetyltransferase n=1 Tax=Lacinutrix iliipiscaria TaxID=1230532 RepID=A0ABW5WQ82_9FLAO